VIRGFLGGLAAAYLVVLAVACSGVLTPAQSADIEGTAGTIARCQALGFACEGDAGPDGSGGACYQVYADCMRDAGLDPNAGGQ
jgi:hypothetical protein